jgi:sugar phosphate isomerase/epimerase
MFVACSTLCFGRLSLDDALQRMRELQFAKVDLAIHAVGPHLTPAQVCTDLQKTMQKLKASALTFAAFHVETDPFDGPEVREQLKAISRLARLLAVPIITVPAAASAAELSVEVARLTDWNKMVMADGLILTVETKQGTHAGTVDGCIALCKAVPGLGLAFDPSHFMTLPEAATEPLYPYIRHVRLRDSGKQPHEFQMRVGQGEIEYSRIHGLLERQKYERTLTVDVRDVADSAFPVEPEVRKLKFLLESMQ